MTDGNFLHQVGVDPNLATAGAAGGLVRALMAKQKVFEALSSVIVGMILANYASKPVATLLSSVEVFGTKLNLPPEFGGVVIGVFSYILIEIATKKLRGKAGDDQKDAAP